MLARLMHLPNLSLLEGEVEDLLVEDSEEISVSTVIDSADGNVNKSSHKTSEKSDKCSSGRIFGIRTKSRKAITAKSVILTTGTFLRTCSVHSVIAC